MAKRKRNPGPMIEHMFMQLASKPVSLEQRAEYVEKALRLLGKTEWFQDMLIGDYRAAPRAILVAALKDAAADARRNPHLIPLMGALGPGEKLAVNVRHRGARSYVAPLVAQPAQRRADQVTFTARSPFPPLPSIEFRSALLTIDPRSLRKGPAVIAGGEVAQCEPPTPAFMREKKKLVRAINRAFGLPLVIDPRSLQRTGQVR